MDACFMLSSYNTVIKSYTVTVEIRMKAANLLWDMMINMNSSY